MNKETTNTSLNLNAESQEAPKKRGNPNWIKKGGEIKRALVTSEFSPVDDIWSVGNKDPELHYSWGRKSNDVEMVDFAHKGYVPARGNETIMGNPFEAAKDTIGQTKERGDRILMCCPKAYKEARQKEKASRYVSAKQAAQDDARKMGGKGYAIETDAEEITKRESIKE